MKKILINGHVVDPSSGLDENADILIEGDRIVELGTPGSIDDSHAQIIDCSGKWVTPGLVDIHVHLREPGFEWKETIASGSKAAVLGGFTTICPMPNTNPVNDTAQTTRFITKKAQEAGYARVHPIGAVSLGLKGREMAPLSEMYEAGCMAFSDDGEPVWDAQLMRRALEWTKMHNAVITCHEEVKSLTKGGVMNESALSIEMGLGGMPREAEDIMIARDIELAKLTGGRVHLCHCSTARGIELVRRAKADGVSITCEVTAHHFHLDESAVEGYNTLAKVSPPLRLQEDLLGIIEGLKDGTVDCIASDHAPHEPDSKNVEFQAAAFGLVGLQSTLPLTLTLVENGTISRLRAIELLSTGGAGCFNLSSGSLSKGALADIAVIDPEHQWKYTADTIASISKNTPFLNREMKGIATDVFVGGRQVVQACELVTIS